MRSAVSLVLLAVLVAAVAVLPDAARQPKSRARRSSAETKIVSMSCPEDYTLLKASCYRVTTEVVAGSEAQAACRRIGGDAAVIDSQEEMDALRESVLRSTVYLGMNLQKTREDFFSFLMKLEGYSGYANFRTGQPAGCDAETCIFADAGNNFAWREGSCTELSPVLCKVAATITPKEPSCAEDAHQFDANTCFWVDTAPEYSWRHALSTCAARGMMLASIHSKQEQEFLHGLAGDRSCWIGLLDWLREGEFIWQDGTPLDFEDWYPGEPRGGKAMSCVSLWKGGGSRWDDYYCSHLNGVVCRGAPQ